MEDNVFEKTYEYRSIERVVFGVGARKNVGHEAAKLSNGRNCLLITDPGVAQAGVIDDVISSLVDGEFKVSVCDEAEPEPTLDAYKKLFSKVRGKTPDVVVGVGGGSTLDMSKAVARAFTNPGKIEDYAGKSWKKPGIPLITMPTTAGTGAKITPESVVIFPDQRVKGCFFEGRPNIAIIDPAMTLTLPPRLTAGTGVDALSHAVESALSKIATPLTQAFAFESIHLISKNLRIATFDGTNLLARTNMAWATLIEAFSESNAGDVEAHAVAHLLGGRYKVHHGEACGIALPYCMKYNLLVNQPILARIAKAMDCSLSGSERTLAEKAIYAVRELIEEVGAPTSLSDIPEAKESDIPELVAVYRSNPNVTLFMENFCKRGVPSEAEATTFFEDMFDPSFELPRRRSSL